MSYEKNRFKPIYLHIKIINKFFKKMYLILCSIRILYYILLYLGKLDETEIHNFQQTQKQPISFRNTRIKKSHHVIFVPKCLEVS